METPLSTSLAPPASEGPLPLRPLGLGEILDRALSTYRAHFKLLFPLMLVFQTLMLVLTEIFTWIGEEKFPVLTRPGAFNGALPPTEQLNWFFIACAGLVPGYLIVYQLAMGALTLAGARKILGEPVDIGAALSGCLRRAPQMLVTFLLFFVGALILVGLSALPGIGFFALAFRVESQVARVACLVLAALLLMFFTVLVALYLWLRYLVVPQVVMLEGLSFFAALRRSALLMRGRIGPTFFDHCQVRASILLAVNFCISLSVLLVLVIPQSIVNGIYGISPLDPQSYDPSVIPLYASIPVKLFQTLGQATVAPFGMLAMVVFYLDLRVKKEGLDLELQAAKLGARQ